MKKVIYHFLSRETSNKDAIEDVIATTFLIVIEKSQSKIVYKNCFSWILTIAKYQLICHNRKQDKILYDSESIEQVGVSNNLNNLSFAFELEKLDFQSQQIFYLIFDAKLTYHQIAKILNISVSTIKRRKNEIIKHFKEFYYNEKNR